MLSASLNKTFPSFLPFSSKNSSPEPESAEAVEYNEVEEIVPEELPPPPPIIEISKQLS